MWESEGERNKYGECQSEVKLALHNVKWGDEYFINMENMMLGFCLQNTERYICPLSTWKHQHFSSYVTV